MPDIGMRIPCALAALLGSSTVPASAQSLVALPDQTSTIRLSNRDINHIICVGGEIEDVKYSSEKAITVERGGSDAWIKFLVKEIDDNGLKSRSFVTTASEFFIACNGAIYPLYAQPSDIPAQTVTLVPGVAQRAQANEALLAPMVEEERAVSISLAILQDRIPASFSELAPRTGVITIPGLPDIRIRERRRIGVEGANLTASDYVIEATAAATLDERHFLDKGLGRQIFAVTLDRLTLAPKERARLVVVRRGEAQ